MIQERSRLSQAYICMKEVSDLPTASKSESATQSLPLLSSCVNGTSQLDAWR